MKISKEAKAVFNRLCNLTSEDKKKLFNEDLSSEEKALLTACGLFHSSFKMASDETKNKKVKDYEEAAKKIKALFVSKRIRL